MRNRFAILVLVAGTAAVEPKPTGAVSATHRPTPAHFAIGGWHLSGQGASHLFPGDRRAKLATAFADIDKILADYATSVHAPGAAWGIVIDGELAHQGAMGVRDVKSKAPVDADTVFRIASMTKSFTAMSILKLRD